MFGASAVRKKREREKREKLARGNEPIIFPYIAPYGPCFDREQLPYFQRRRLQAYGEEVEQSQGGQGSQGGPGAPPRQGRQPPAVPPKPGSRSAKSGLDLGKV